jgi:tetratricopeptide (TPR) repeat protein
MTAADDLFARAEALSRAGRREEALRAVDEALAADPMHAAALTLKGGLRLETGDREGALALCDQAIAAGPAYPRAHAHRAAALDALGRPEEALASYGRAVALQPDNVAALVSRGAILSGLKRWAEALASYDAAIALRPDIAQAHGNRALCLSELERHEEALAAADRAIALQPTYARGWRRRGDALLALDRHEEALESYSTGAKHEANDHVLVGVALSLKGLGRYAEAIAALDEAETLNPGGALAPHYRAALRLMQGDFEQGWRDYEARWRHPGFLAQSNGLVTPTVAERLHLDPEPADLARRRLLVVAEQGIGDQLMHASLLPDLLQAGCDVTWACDDRLHRLLSNSFPDVRLLSRQDVSGVDLDGFERILASGSLAHAYRRTAEDFPGTPYVRPSEEAVEAWAEKVGARRRKLRIGVSWRGGTQRTGRNRRSMSLSELAPLLARTDCEFVSLQYGDAATEVAEAAADIRVFPPAEIDDFEDLAALVANLDLVVSVQTAVVHLCGALGCPAVAMVPAQPEWRYMAAGPSMPWYRSVHIVRQDVAGRWGEVVAKVVRAVDERAQG